MRTALLNKSSIEFYFQKQQHTI